jgi:hypothetical protein
MGQKNIDDDLMNEKWKSDKGREALCSTQNEREDEAKRQQKIARFECIQLFLLFMGNCLDMTSSGGFPVPLIVLRGVKIVKMCLLTRQQSPRDIAYGKAPRRLTVKCSRNHHRLRRANLNNSLLDNVGASKHEERFFSCSANAWIKWLWHHQH